MNITTASSPFVTPLHIRSHTKEHERAGTTKRWKTLTHRPPVKNEVVHTAASLSPHYSHHPPLPPTDRDAKVSSFLRHNSHLFSQLRVLTPPSPTLPPHNHTIAASFWCCSVGPRCHFPFCGSHVYTSPHNCLYTPLSLAFLASLAILPSRLSRSRLLRHCIS